MIPETQPISTQPLSIKIELVRDSEFFHRLLHELSHAAALHDTEKRRFLGNINDLEGQLTVAVSLINMMYLHVLTSYAYRLHPIKVIYMSGEKSFIYT